MKKLYKLVCVVCKLDFRSEDARHNYCGCKGGKIQHILAPETRPLKEANFESHPT